MVRTTALLLAFGSAHATTFILGGEFYSDAACQIPDRVGWTSVYSFGGQAMTDESAFCSAPSQTGSPGWCDEPSLAGSYPPADYSCSTDKGGVKVTVYDQAYGTNCFTSMVAYTAELPLDVCTKYSFTLEQMEGCGPSDAPCTYEGYVKATDIQGCSECPAPPGGGGGGDDPCFGRDSTTACLVSPGATAAEALPQCLGDAPATTATAVPMSSLSAGDLVLADENSITRVIVNQHVPAKATSSFVKIAHADGALTLTPDHVLKLDGEWRPAREAKVGSRLSNGNDVTAVASAIEGIINPLTTAGSILANGVVSSVYPEWIHFHMHSSKVYPLPLSASNLLSYLFPAHTQAFYNVAIEPLFAGGNRAYLEAVPPALVTPAVAFVDSLIAAGFLAAPALLAFAGAALAARVSKA